MNLILIKLFSFFVGLFITLAILSYYKLNEPFTIPDKYIEAFHNKEKEKEKDKDDNKMKDENNEDNAIIPYSGYKFMSINTYSGLDKISYITGKWYDIDTDENKTYDFNYNNYFKYSKIINLYNNSINKNGAKYANINEIELTGPSCYNFANNSETFELTSFTMFITAKINNCSIKNNILFEMTGNTVAIDDTIPKYTTSIINIILVIDDNLNYNIHLTIGNVIYKTLINDIDKSLIEDNDYITIGLYLSDDKIGLLINKKIYEYTNINKYKITLGTTPIIINKNGTINMGLYNFVYYKYLYPFNNYYKISAYDNYYISGLDYTNKNKKCPKEEKKEEKKEEEEDKLKISKRIIIPEFKYDEIIDYYTPDILKKIFDY